MTKMLAKYRSDYQRPDFTISQVDLTFHLANAATRVESHLQISRQGSHQRPLVLQGEQLQLLELQIDGVVLDESAYRVEAEELIIDAVPETFSLTVITQINPSTNKALEGLYLADGTFCTQCEAEGFRRITYYLDLPDVLAEFTTTIFADAKTSPYLLSNGNCVAKGQAENGQHWAKWHDPHPKPSYLFALVAGDFDVLNDEFVTRSKRSVALQLFVDKGNLDRAEHAMASLKRSMQWDEDRFNLEYDLDIYMIVAVDFFNMGAMENKGLNVFNSKYVLANPATATDQDFLNVESVIGHEYFHNWTGNRITCRDWFQLSLKEGLTVFRDQEFSADLGSRAVNRIQDVRIMRTHQFNEDASPMAHPIRPDKVIEMNNFYTVTVYNKGAEVIRMLHTLLGEAGFQQGMQTYIERYDGQAVTCEDFISAMEDANQRDFQQFRRWYSQAGTPTLTITEEYDAEAQQLILTIEQSLAATPGQTDKQPMHMPVVISAYNQAGERLPLALGTLDGSLGEIKAPAISATGGTILELTEAKQQWVFQHLSSKPTLALMENFSAPVKLVSQQTADDLLLLSRCAHDAVVRWDAIQQLLRDQIKQAVQTERPAVLPEQLAVALRDVLQADIDPALRALALATPSADELAEDYAEIPVDQLTGAVAELETAIGKALSADFARVYAELETMLQTAPASASDGESIAKRSLRNRCLHYLTVEDTAANTSRVTKQFYSATNMTDQVAALNAAVTHAMRCQNELLDAFAEQWQGNTLVMDKWLASQSVAAQGDVLERVEALLTHSAFSLDNPNRVYALLATFSRNLRHFHRADGAGYKLIADAIVALNSMNPQVASRLITPFTQWRRVDKERQQLMLEQLKRIQQLPDLAGDLYEKISQSLAADANNNDTA